MADDDSIGESLGDDGVDAGGGKKGGKLGALFSGVLKWVIIGIAATIVIVVVVVVTVKIVSNNKSSVTSIPNSEEYISGQREIYDWYKSIGTIQTTTSDDIPATVRANVFLAYKKDDKATATEITARSVELKDYLRKYFRGKTSAELRNANNEDALKIEIRNGINDKILSSSKIRDISFDQLDVIEQN